MVRRIVWSALLFVVIVGAAFSTGALAGGQKSAFALREKCARGDLGACAEGSMVYVFGDGVNWDVAEAEHMARKACEGGETAGCVNLARILLIGYQVHDKEIQDARTWLRAACVDQQHELGCISLGWLYVRGEGPLDEAPPVAFLAERCEAGSGAACLVAGQLHAEGIGAPVDASAAFGRFQQACEAGSADGCARLGTAYAGGEGVAADPAKAKALYDRACNGGSLDGCARAAHALREGLGAPANPAKADAAIAKLCGGDHARKCAARGQILKDGALEGPANPQGMVQLYGYACSSGYTFACHWLGYHLDRGDALPRDRAAAAKHYQVACDKGMEEACTDLGVLYHHGWGVPYDGAKAIALWKDACEGHRDPNGCVWYARALRDGAGVDRDAPKAFSFMNRACNAGHGAACDELGLMYRDGVGVTADAEMAATMFRRSCLDTAGAACVHLARHAEATGVDAKIPALELACENGSWDTCVGVGQLHAMGAATPKDTPKALAFYQKGCDREVTWGCRALAEVHLDGCGVEPDPAKGLAIAQSACDLGDALACDMARRASTPGAAAPAEGDAAVARLQLLCEEGWHGACGLLGDRYLTGRGAPQDVAMGKRMLEDACRLGDSRSCGIIGERWLDGALGTDLPRGVAYLEQSCEAAYDTCPGDVWSGDEHRGCRVLGEAYASGLWGLAADAEKAKPLLDRACQGGDQRSCEALAALAPAAAAEPGVSAP